jgi:uncharacterized membrane protein YidH (DUF202 family)
MRTTRASTLISVAVVAAIAGFALDAALTSRRLSVPALSPALGLTLIGIGIALVIMATPVRRHVKGTATRRVDPLYATRVVVLAKASSIVGSLLGAFSLGLLVYLLTRSVVAGLGSTVPCAVAFGGGLVLTVCALVAERMCIAPPQDDDDEHHRGGGTTAI